MIYLGWYDDNRNKQSTTKIDEAIARYRQKYGVNPNICLVSEQELIEHPHIRIRRVQHLSPYYYYVGVDEAAPRH
jgi:hypothetical protein